MKKNIWKELKKENDAKALNLEIEDQRYLDKVKSYAINQGVGMTEMEIIRKDLIGMAEESQKNGERLEKIFGRREGIYRKSGYRRKTGGEKRSDLLLYSGNRKIIFVCDCIGFLCLNDNGF